MQSIELPTPYATAARAYLDAGWWPIPVADEGGKSGIPAGYTGNAGRHVTLDDVATWVHTQPTANVALRMPPDVIAIDVDAYGDKPGGQTLDELERRLGPLPATWVATARDLPAGKMLYRVPNGTRLRSTMGPGIDVCQFHHRYVVVAPSAHHTGAVVRWIDNGSGELHETTPTPDDLPDLPWAWLEEFSSSGSGEIGDAADDAAVRAWIERTAEHCQRPAWLAAITARVTEAVNAGQSRHDTVLAALCQVARETEAGAYSAADALAQLRRIWNQATSGEEREGEFPDMVAWAVGQAATSAGRQRIEGKRDELAVRHADVIQLAPRQEEPPPPYPTIEEPPAVNPVDETTQAHNPLGKYIIDWDTFWATDHNATEWICEPLFAAGRAHALFAGAKTGKSFLVLAATAAMATGRPFLDKPASEPVDVLYVDYEMTPDDLHDRLLEFGYGPDDDLSHLHYALLPSMPPLDTDPGGLALSMAADACGARFVVIDTTGRATEGDENEASTFQDFYRHTGLRLKQAGIGWVRLDHAGKDAEKGQRGSSAKNDDVDIVVKLTRTDSGVTVKATHRRVGWYPESTAVEIGEDGHGVTTFTAVRGEDHRPYAHGTVDLVKQLDQLDVPVELSRRAVRPILKKAGITATNTVLSDAIRFRRATADDIRLAPRPVDNSSDHSTDHEVVHTPRTTDRTTEENPADKGRTTHRTTSDHMSDGKPDHPVPLKEDRVGPVSSPTPTQTPIDLSDF